MSEDAAPEVSAEDDESGDGEPLTPAQLFERLAHVRSGISDGVITPW